MHNLRLSQSTLGIVLFFSLFASHALLATALSCGSQFNGEITSASQVDQYTYAGEAGGIITLSFSGSPSLSLFDPSGTQLSLSGGYPQQVTLPLTGTYVIQVKVASSTQPYNYYYFGQLVCRNPVSPAIPLSCGQTVSGGIGFTSQVVQYAYTGQAGGMITLALAKIGGLDSPSASAVLFDPSGKEVLRFSDQPPMPQVTLALSGTYLIQVTGYTYDSKNPLYSLEVVCRNPLEPATPLSCGGIVGSFGIRPGRVDQYAYAGHAGEIITLTWSDNSPYASSRATLFDPSGNQVLLLGGYGGPGPYHGDQVTLASTGAYVIQVTGGNYDFSASYSLGVVCRNPLQPATPLSCGGVANGSVRTAQVNQYAFAGQAGGNITLTSTDTGSYGSAYASLFDPSGKAVLSFSGSSGPQPVTLAWTGTYVIQVSGVFQPGSSTSYTLGMQCNSGMNGEGFVPVPPCRIADTRVGSGFSDPFGAPSLTAHSTRTFPIPSGSCGIPSRAQAYSLNVTVVPPAPLTYLSIWPTGELQPLVSTLNSFDGRVVANAAIVPAGANGAVDVYASDNTDVILDINGYFDPDISSTAAFYPDTPCRLADTRGYGFTGSFGPPSMVFGETRTFPLLSSSCGIASTAGAYSLNATVVPRAEDLDYLSLWPTGQGQPVVSTLNSFDGRVVANAAIVPAGNDGAISAFVTDNADLIFDLNGHFGPGGATGALQLHPVSPCRVVDTRGYGFSGAFGPPSLAAGATRSFTIPGSCGIPPNAKAYALNMTVVPTGFLGYLTTWPTGQPQPYVSTLNSYTGTVLANAALVPAGTDGAISVFVTDNTDLIIDINGYFAP
ncbi:MAG TPA: hypothetical protein VLJ11_12885 [Bryobacteraceae bacterium]|nr:hypothetical protein [Bryobacteraceae bacterium]